MVQKEFDFDKYPDGISKIMEINDYDQQVWERGYYLDVNDGIWYELYVNDTVKHNFNSIPDDFNDKESIIYSMRGFQGLWIGDYEDNSQITFFVPNGETVWTYREMTNIFI